MIDRHRLPRLLFVLLVLVAGACADREPPRQYVLQGQILAVHADRMALTIRHDEIPGLMAAMTMTFPVGEKRLLDGRVPGETVTATLEVRNAVGRLVSVTHTGTAPLPSADDGGAKVPALAIGDHLPDLAVIDAHDRRRSLAEWRGTATILTFTHARCTPADECATIGRHFLALQRAIARDAALTGRTRLVSMTVDPAHDTAAVLAAHARTQQADPAVWTFLTADAVSVARLAGRFGITVTARDAAAPAYHPKTIVISPEGRVLAIHDGAAWDPSAVLTDLTTTPQGSK